MKIDRKLLESSLDTLYNVDEQIEGSYYFLNNESREEAYNTLKKLIKDYLLLKMALASSLGITDEDVEEIVEFCDFMAKQTIAAIDKIRQKGKA